MEVQLGAGFSKSIWIERPCVAKVRKNPLEQRPDGHCTVRTLWSGISRGTERLVFEGRVPEAEYDTMRCPAQEGDFPAPVKYGYCAVGTVEDGPEELAGRMVFALHPHQDFFHAPVSMLNPLPESLPPRRAILAANMETALNAVWDSGVGAGDRVLVVGAGALGLLMTSILAALPGAEVFVADPDLSRAAVVSSFGARFLGQERPGDDHDVVFHTSASEAGLATAIAAAGREATIVEASWYGEGLVPAPLGGRFHSHRLRLVSTQVGSIPAGHAARWDYRRRMATALRLLADDDRLDSLITSEVSFDDLPGRMPEILAPGAPGIVTAVRYN
jgi:NADPH:quinone reductase-like Zn-dependent oxidoreductase